MAHRIELTKAARRALASLPRNILKRVDAAILALAHNPRPPGAKKLEGQELYRIRVGDYRIIYAMEDERLVVLVVRIGHRREVYRRG